jgi:tRNA (pseudouridine54-N1)-methyltransferase
VRRTLLLAHRVPVSGAFTLNDLAGGAGRMDEVARCVSTAFTLSNALRTDAEMTILFVAEPPPRARRIEVIGSRLRFLNPDERSTAALLKNALVRSIPVEHDMEVSPGLRVGPVEPLAALREFAARPGAFWLREDGEDHRGSPLIGGGFSAILSDPTDPTPEEAETLRAVGVPRISLGPRSMRSSQCLDVLNHEADLKAAGSSSGAAADGSA